MKIKVFEFFLQGVSHIRVQTPRVEFLVHAMNKFYGCWGVKCERPISYMVFKKCLQEIFITC